MYSYLPYLQLNSYTLMVELSVGKKWLLRCKIGFGTYGRELYSNNDVRWAIAHLRGLCKVGCAVTAHSILRCTNSKFT